MSTKLEIIANAFKNHTDKDIEISSKAKVSLMKGKSGFITIMIEEDLTLANSLKKMLSNHARKLGTVIETAGSGQQFTTYSAHFEVFFGAIQQCESIHKNIAQACTEKSFAALDDDAKSIKYLTVALQESGGFDFDVEIPKNVLGGPASQFAKKQGGPSNSPSAAKPCAIL